jgi:hypothetical protein
MVKVTFTLDGETIAAIRELARRKRKPQSLVVREAIAAYAAQEDKLSDGERDRRVRALDEILARPRTRPQAEVEHELREIRRARRTGWRRASD